MKNFFGGVFITVLSISFLLTRESAATNQHNKSGGNQTPGRMSHTIMGEAVNFQPYNPSEGHFNTALPAIVHRSAGSLVIRNDEEYKDVYGVNPTTKIDWKKESIIVLNLGEHVSSSPPTFAIKSIGRLKQDNKNILLVNYTIHPTGKGSNMKFKTLTAVKVPLATIDRVHLVEQSNGH